MRVKLIVVGKTSEAYLQEGEKEYENRLRRFVSFDQVVIPELKGVKSLSVEQVKQKESDLILKQFAASDYVILLDEKGREFTSQGFSNFFDKKGLQGVSSLVFVVGGAFGFHEKVYARSNEKLALSKMTYSHQMVRLIFKEQLYRAFTISKGHPYHHS